MSEIATILTKHLIHTDFLFFVTIAPIIDVFDNNLKAFVDALAKKLPITHRQLQIKRSKST